MNQNRDYYNYTNRHIDVLVNILQQMETMNRNMYDLTNREARRTRATSNLRSTMNRPYASSRENRNYSNTSQNFSNFATSTPITNSNIPGSTFVSRPTTFNTVVGNNDTNTNTGNLNNNTNRRNLNNVLTSWFWDPVTVSPSQQEIEAATSSITFEELPEGVTSCPITMETFTENTDLLRINHCGHVFARPGIMRWFRNHISCPVCRHDIRNTNDITTGNITDNTNNDDNENNTNLVTRTYQLDFNLNPQDILSSIVQGSGMGDINSYYSRDNNTNL